LEIAGMTVGSAQPTTAGTAIDFMRRVPEQTLDARLRNFHSPATVIRAVWGNADLRGRFLLAGPTSLDGWLVVAARVDDVIVWMARPRDPTLGYAVRTSLRVEDYLRVMDAVEVVWSGSAR
jgi:hypothetical protein